MKTTLQTLIKMRDEKLQELESMNERINNEIKFKMWQCNWINQRDCESISIIVTRQKEIVFDGHYNIRTNWAHIYAVEGFEHMEDFTSLIAEKIETREIEIEKLG